MLQKINPFNSCSSNNTNSKKQCKKQCSYENKKCNVDKSTNIEKKDLNLEKNKEDKLMNQKISNKPCNTDELNKFLDKLKEEKLKEEKLKEEKLKEEKLKEDYQNEDILDYQTKKTMDNFQKILDVKKRKEFLKTRNQMFTFNKKDELR